MPIFRISQTAFFLNFAHKGRTSRLDIRMGNDATPLGKIAHNGLQEDTFLSVLLLFSSPIHEIHLLGAINM